MIRLACPRDRTPLGVETDTARCPKCGTEYHRRDGIWRFLLQPERFQSFLDHYQTVRRAENWGSGDPSYYLSLPNVAEDDPHRDVWRVRAASFNSLVSLLGSARRVLDLGAGNGWLAYQLARRGLDVAAVDVSDDALDGLGASRHYPIALDCYQAEFDALPFAGSQFDLVIFNASLHYAHSMEVTLREGLRVLDPAGRIVVMDSPIYRNKADGNAMLARRAADFRSSYGFDDPGDAVGFLTFRELESLANAFGLQWRWSEPRVDVRWGTRHLRAKLAGKPEPAHFGLMIGQVKRTVMRS